MLLFKVKNYLSDKESMCWKGALRLFFSTGGNRFGLTHSHSCLVPLLTNCKPFKVQLVMFRDAICSHEKRVFLDEELIGL